MAQVSLLGVTKGWGSFKNVSEASLEIADREFVVFLSPSGCGKTTWMIAGLKDLTDGQIRIGRRVVNDLEPRGRDVATMFQNYGLCSHLSIYANIRFS